MADISGWRADDFGCAVGFHVFAHVESQEGLVVIEEELGEGFGEFGFADAGGAEEKEGTEWAVFGGDAGFGATDDIADGFDGFGLADDTFLEFVFEVEEFFGFGGGEALKRDAGPTADDGGNVLLRDLLFENAGFFAFEFFDLFFEGRD